MIALVLSLIAYVIATGWALGYWCLKSFKRLKQQLALAEAPAWKRVSALAFAAFQFGVLLPFALMLAGIGFIKILGRMINYAG